MATPATTATTLPKEDAEKKNKEDFKRNEEILKNKKLDIDKYENILYIEGSEDGLIKAVQNYKQDSTSSYLGIFIKHFLYVIKKNVNIFTENFMYQFNEIYDKPYTYYHVFLNICFITLIIILSLILYWDNVYRCAKERSRCSDIKEIMEENSVSPEPYLYGVMIINKKHLDQLMNKYVMIIVYDFQRKSTKVIYGDKKYLDEVKNFKAENMGNSFRYYDIAQYTFQYDHTIDANIITNDNFKYIPIDSKNNVVNSDVAKNLAKFVKDYTMNMDTLLHPVYDIMNAYEQNYNKVNL